MSASPAEARIEQLEQIEEDVIAILRSAGNCVVEIAKDRPSQKAVDANVQQVMTNIKSVDSKLSEQIKYLTQVSTGHPHEGSSYASQKVNFQDFLYLEGNKYSKFLGTRISMASS